jgi:hypothetical protein
MMPDQLDHEDQEFFDRFDEERRLHDAVTIGELLDLIDPRNDSPDTEQLLMVTEIAIDLLSAAVLAADSDDNTPFFYQALEQHGLLIRAVIAECGARERNPITGQSMP